MNSASAPPTPAEAVRVLDGIVAANHSVRGLAVSWSVVRALVAPAASQSSSASLPVTQSTPQSSSAVSQNTSDAGQFYFVFDTNSQPLIGAREAVAKVLHFKNKIIRRDANIAEQLPSFKGATVVLLVYFRSSNSYPVRVINEYIQKIRASGAGRIFALRIHPGYSGRLDNTSYDLPYGHVIDGEFPSKLEGDFGAIADYFYNQRDGIGEKLVAALKLQPIGAVLCATGCGKPATQYNCGRTAVVCSEMCCAVLRDD